MTHKAQPSPESTRDLPSLTDSDDSLEGEATRQQSLEPSQPNLAKRPLLTVLRGDKLGEMYKLGEEPIVIGRSPESGIHLEEGSISRMHAKIYARDRDLVVEDMGSANGTYVNGQRVAMAVIRHGDQIGIGPLQLLKLEYQDEIEESARRHLVQASKRQSQTIRPVRKRPWSIDSWTSKPVNQAPVYEDAKMLATVVSGLRRLPPLVTSWEVEELKKLLAEAQEGKRFLLQGGDCAETFDDCNPSVITNKLKILLQMSLVLVHAIHRPVIRVGRFAGQYAKPRSKPTEVRNGVELPSYVGDLVNRPQFTAQGRRPNPKLLLAGYEHAAMTLNFIRAMAAGGFTDLRRPEYYDLSFFDRAEHPTGVRREHQAMSRRIAEALHFVSALGAEAVSELTRAFFTSHEGLNLIYESAQTRRVPRREGYYDLTTHMPWIGERTRALEGAHVEFFRGIANPVGVKIGPSAKPEEVLELCEALNPDNEPGKIVLIARMGAARITAALPPLIETMMRNERRVLWVSDPMHGNMIVTSTGLKTRNFDDILREVELSIDVHEQLNSYFGGVHFELTGDDVTECIGGGLTEDDLNKQYLTACDPRLNYRQAVEMAFSIARRMHRLPSVPPSPESQ